MTVYWVLVGVMSIGQMKQLDITTSVAIVKKSFTKQKDCLEKVEEFKQEMENLRRKNHPAVGGVGCIEVVPQLIKDF